MYSVIVTKRFRTNEEFSCYDLYEDSEYIDVSEGVIEHISEDELIHRFAKHHPSYYDTFYNTQFYFAHSMHRGFIISNGTYKCAEQVANSLLKQRKTIPHSKLVVGPYVHSKTYANVVSQHLENTFVAVSDGTLFVTNSDEHIWYVENLRLDMTHSDDMLIKLHLRVNDQTFYLCTDTKYKNSGNDKTPNDIVYTTENDFLNTQLQSSNYRHQPGVFRVGQHGELLCENWEGMQCWVTYDAQTNDFSCTHVSGVLPNNTVRIVTY